MFYKFAVLTFRIILPLNLFLMLCNRKKQLINNVITIRITYFKQIQDVQLWTTTPFNLNSVDLRVTKLVNTALILTSFCRLQSTFIIYIFWNFDRRCI